VKLGHEKGTVKKISSICRSIESLRRRKELTFEHHYQVASFSPEEQDDWLQQAVDNKWSIRELKKVILAS